MRGGEWIVPVVVLIVWLVSTILKSREQDEPVRPRRPGGGDGRKPSSDIDKFLQEIDRLRRKSADENPARPAPARPRPVVAAPPPVPRVRAARPVRLQPAVEAVVVEAVPAVTAAPIAPRSEFVAPPPAPAKPRVAQVSTVEQRSSPAVTAALHLLRSPRTLAAAVVLEEVLGPPKSKRR
ncbi:MAG TPA: hypothetical protein VGF55_33965 [Gemmataceae bacterium]|jgi:hypothetical protein